MKKETKQTITKSDMNIQPTSPVFPTSIAVISDGEINTNNLRVLNVDQKWLEQQLQSKNISTFTNVFYAEVQKDGTLYVDKKDNTIH